MGLQERRVLRMGEALAVRGVASLLGPPRPRKRGPRRVGRVGGDNLLPKALGAWPKLSEPTMNCGLMNGSAEDRA